MDFHKGWTRWIERAALAMLILYFSVHTLPKAWKGLITDFPNYYLAAQMARQGVDTSRMYEWQWIEREKDHRAIPIRIIGLLPITPFSTLFLWPLAGLKPLAAKHIWIIFSLALLVPLSWMLRQMTHLSYARITLIFALSVPLYRNIEFGQFYVVLLMLIVAACWCSLRGRHALSGALIAIAAAAKIFPLIFFVFFLQRRNWRALAAGAITGAATIALSVGAFGWSAHRTYLEEILPATLHGEAFPPYVTAASISGILHVLFLAEPQWNPRPWFASVAAYSILFPVLSMLVLAPAILLLGKQENPRRTLLEWSALLTAALAVSTIPASYNFVLMVLPVCVLGAILLEQERYAWLGALLVAYIGVCLPVRAPDSVEGLAVFLYTPRLPFLLAILAGIYTMLWRERDRGAPSRDWTRPAWVAVMILWAAAGIHSTWVRESGVRKEFAYRLPLKDQGLLNAHAQSQAGQLRYISFGVDGYHLLTADGADHVEDPAAQASVDALSYTSGHGRLLVEHAMAPVSMIVNPAEASQPVLENAQNPMLSADGRTLAFLRDDRGRRQLLAHSLAGSAGQADRTLTPPALNVYEAAFLSESEYAVAAAQGSQPPQIYLTDAAHSNAPIGLGESRYPALSPDGAWLAYSRMQGGVWNLWIRDQRTGAVRRIGDVPCNEIQPSWLADGKTILYSTDCGRSLWFTAIARRRVIP